MLSYSVSVLPSYHAATSIEMQRQSIFLSRSRYRDLILKSNAATETVLEGITHLIIEGSPSAIECEQLWPKLLDRKPTVGLLWSYHTADPFGLMAFKWVFKNVHYSFVWVISLLYFINERRTLVLSCS
jgi:hypothetical protein